MKTVVFILTAYLLGAIPWAYLIGRITKGIDIRDYGSGNVGFTNALRTIGKVPAFLVLIGDVGKGIVAVLIAKHFGSPLTATLAGLAVVIGHNYPIFLGFRGGKGAAAGFGALITLLPLEGFLAIIVWIITVFLTRYVSLGTILGALTVPIATLYFHHEIHYILFSFLGAIFVIYKHHSNISRLLKGCERKIGKD
ncbi:MAG: glycerol-3-phosphate 1-O-acyltransferase PlsY [Bacillota bacterium]|jgi:glycerol-3-phosphate acyltransferase PlsY|nr:glycerol-3-phosphate 1-O-acyltransferase PlsY [Clostridia bacterium]